MKTLTALAAVVLAGAPISASAATWFSSEAAFLAAAPGAADPTGMSSVVSDAEAVALMEASPNSWRLTGTGAHVDFTLGDVTFHVPGAAPGQGHYFLTGIAGQDPEALGFAGATYRIGNPRDEQHHISIGGDGAQAFGFSIYEKNYVNLLHDVTCGTPCVISGFRVEAFGADGSLGSWTHNFTAAGGVQFVGLTSEVPIVRLEISETRLGGGSRYGCCLYDNEYFGNYLMVGAGGAVGGVPEPATWALLIGGFALTGGLLRRRRAASAALA